MLNKLNKLYELYMIDGNWGEYEAYKSEYENFTLWLRSKGFRDDGDRYWVLEVWDYKIKVSRHNYVVSASCDSVIQITCFDFDTMKTALRQLYKHMAFTIKQRIHWEEGKFCD